jgi:hypothetical protein
VALFHINFEHLKLTLQLHGLLVVHAEVHTQPGDRGQRGASGWHPHSSPIDDGDGDDAGPRVGTGYVTAQGLDCWA